MATKTWVNIGYGNSLLPDGTEVNQCWLVISKVKRDSHEGNLTKHASAINLYN